MTIHVLHENSEWVEPLRHELDRRGLPYAEWFLNDGIVDFQAPPPEGVFYNRMSASSHTRGHVYAPEHAKLVLAWLEAHGRTVLNGSQALRLEVSKVEQYLEFARFGIAAPMRSFRPPASSQAPSSPSTTGPARAWGCSCSASLTR
ncbi:MAG: hypothetical protein OXR84_15125 [Magnetovibrio sp.]|nr:hypothetical protein [Magnetovibrio sp.]